MREVELFRRGTSHTLIPISAGEEKNIASPISVFAEAEQAIYQEEQADKEFFFAKVKGEEMMASGIYPGEMLVVDQDLIPVHGDIVIGEDEGEFILRSYFQKDGRTYLLTDNSYFKPVDITGNSRYKIFGVVPHSLVDQRRRSSARINRFEQLLR